MYLFCELRLPYYIGDVITDRNKLFVQTVPGMSKRFNLDIRNFSEVVSIDKENKKVTVKDIKKDELYEETFDKLVISTGAKPIRPRIEGMDEAKNLFVLRNIPDTDAIKNLLHPEISKRRR